MRSRPVKPLKSTISLPMEATIPRVLSMHCCAEVIGSSTKMNQIALKSVILCGDLSITISKGMKELIRG
jgi:hypothetical protein